VGEQIDSLAGILRFANEAYKIEPRGLEDVTQGPASINAFSAPDGLAIVGVTQEITDSMGDVIVLSLTSPAPEGGEVVTLTTVPTGVLDVPSTVTFPAGSYQLSLQATGVSVGDITLTASIPDRGEAQLSVEVIDADTQPTSLQITPDMISIGAGGSAVLTVSFNYPAPENYTLTVTVGDAGLISAPASIAVDQGARFVELEVQALTGSGDSSLIVSAGVASAEAIVTVSEIPFGGALVINELDINQPGEDTAEFIELYNASGGALDLSDYRLELINGSNNAQYNSFDLGMFGTLAAGQFFVLANAGVSVDAGALSGILPANGLQNGSPDGAKVVRISTGEVVDGLSYGGNMDGITEGNSTEAESGDGSLARCIDGADSDDNQADFTLTLTPTPGAPNQCN
jgi:hypothetical protein